MVVRYESSEARDLLGRAAGSLGRDKTDRERAAAACLTAFEELVREFDGPSSVFYTRRTSSSVVEFGRVHSGLAVFIALRDNDLVIRTKSGTERKVELDYNVATGFLEGKDEDPFTVPVPGKPRLRRSALAVLAEAALEAITPVDPNRA